MKRRFLFHGAIGAETGRESRMGMEHAVLPADWSCHGRNYHYYYQQDLLNQRHKEVKMGYTVKYESTIFSNPANKYCIVSVKTADTSVPAQARDKRRYRDHLIHFTAVGYGIPMTDAVELELEGEWVDGKYGMQLQVEQCHEIVQKTEEGVLAYLGSGLIKGIGEKTAAQIVARFGVGTLDILENRPERLLEVRGITENKLQDIRDSYRESRMLRDILALLAPFKLTPKTAQKVYDYFGPACLDILRKSPFELCRMPGFGFRRVDAIVRKTDNRPHDPMRVKGALHCALTEAKGNGGHLYLEKEELHKEALRLLNEMAPLPEMRVRESEVEKALEEMILGGKIVSAKGCIYSPAAFAQEDATAREVAKRLAVNLPVEGNLDTVLASVKSELGLQTAAKQEAAVRTAFQYNLSIITGSPGTGKTTVLKVIIAAYRKLFPKKKISLMAPTGRASRRMAESTGFLGACTLHSGLKLASEEDGERMRKDADTLDADLVIIDEFSMVDMWLASKLFTSLKEDAKVVLVGDPDQLPSVGAGNVFRELIQCGLVPVTVLDVIFRQAEDSLIAHNAKFINEGDTKLYYGEDFQFLPCESQETAAAAIIERYCSEIRENGIEHVQILSPFRTDGAASADNLNAAIREVVNPFRSTEDEIQLGAKTFRVGDRIMQTKNTDKVSNGDLGFIRYIKDTGKEKRIGLGFGEDRQLEYGVEDLANLSLAYATTIHKGMGSEYDIVLMPLLKAHYVMLYRNLLYTGITRAKKRVVLVGQKQVLHMAVHRNEISKRNTLLGERIRLYYKAFARSAGLPVPAFPEGLKAAG
ncbi:ATP-dependent RecD-like DNA helicase [uncultured Acetatifactor sp.]|uniref:SF1B family DNA helicase RecD2 n=1 Tax=uncultured Acetatifactor sp. TaxID=1671927 RepID=UPI002ECFD24B